MSTNSLFEIRFPSESRKMVFPGGAVGTFVCARISATAKAASIAANKPVVQKTDLTRKPRISFKVKNLQRERKSEIPRRDLARRATKRRCQRAAMKVSASRRGTPIKFTF